MTKKTSKTKTYDVVIPIAGTVQCTVTVPDGTDPDGIFEAACNLYNSHPDECELEWEFMYEISSGNVLHASQNEWEYTEVRP